MLIEHSGDLFFAWEELNRSFLRQNLGLSIVKSAGVYASLPFITLKAFGIRPDHDSILFRRARLDLLGNRYIDSELWKECVDRFKKSPTGATHVFHFNRRGDRPKGGGCLLNIVLVRRSKKSWQVMINSRAEEITMALYADIKFIEDVLAGLSDLLELGLDLKTIPIQWNIGLAHQNRVFVPVFIYDVLGISGFNSWKKQKGDTEWEKICIDHTKLMIKGEKVTGARALWGRRLKQWTS